MFPVLIALVATALAETPTHEGGQLHAGPIAFAPSTATLTPESAATIDAIAAWLAANPGVPLRVEVHTDSRGSDAYNLRMSQDRAEAVVAALTAKGVAADRLTAQGWGETKPLATNSTTEGRDQNRRIELWTTPTTEAPPVPEAPAPPPAAPPRDALCVTLDEAVASARRGFGTQPPQLTDGDRCSFPTDGVASCRYDIAPGVLIDRVEACLPGWTEVERSVAFLLLQDAGGVQVQVSNERDAATISVAAPRR